MSDTSNNSFLTEDQLQGKAAGEVDLQGLSEAIENVCHIIDEEVVTFYKTKDESEWPTSKVSVYNHEIKQIVPAGIGQTLRGNPRTVCGLTGSKKVSVGREEALKKYYHIKEIPNEEMLEAAKKSVEMAKTRARTRPPTHKQKSKR